jgi:hypothetical protein
MGASQREGFQAAQPTLQAWPLYEAVLMGGTAVTAKTMLGNAPAHITHAQPQVPQPETKTQPRIVQMDGGAVIVSSYMRGEPPHLQALRQCANHLPHVRSSGRAREST